MADSRTRRALVSVSDKTGLAPFVKDLVKLGFEILSTGGTARHLQDEGIDVVDVSTYTGFPEIMDGRVKTLHPKVHGAILGRPDLPSDAAALSEHQIVPFELVVCNLYPFEQTVSKPDVTPEQAIEQIDIGGPSMVRSAAKNHAYVGIVTDPAQYPRVLEELQSGILSAAFRRQLATAAFRMTARYDAAISHWFNNLESEAEDDTRPYFPDILQLEYHRQNELRYGENPHQTAAVYTQKDPDPSTLAAAEKLHGKELSYNNLLDLDAALGIVREFEEPAAVIIKHNNPCGCGVASAPADAFDRAYAGDPVSAFGSILGFNRVVDLATAEKLCEPNRFIEAIIAPGYDADAFELLITRPKWKANVRLLRLPSVSRGPAHAAALRSISGGLLVQEQDDQEDPRDDWEVMTRRSPTEAERRDLAFAWKICKHVKSNAIVLAKGRSLLGVGAGQMSRLDSAHIAAVKAGERAQGAAAASDAFFPFRDGLDELAKTGIKSVIQPGGSRGDDEVIAAADEHGIAMIFTGRRHFRH